MQSLTSWYFLQRLWFCFSLCMVGLHLNCYKQRCVITIITNIILYICNPSPINQAKYGAWQLLRHTATDQTRPEQSHGQDSNCSRPQPKWSNAISRGDQSGAALFSVDFCSIAVIAIVMWQRNRSLWIHSIHDRREFGVFWRFDSGFSQEVDKFTNDIISNLIIK